MSESLRSEGQNSTGRSSDGRTLRRLLEESGHLDWQDVTDLGIQIAERLDAAYQQGQQGHRLITPDAIVQSRDGLRYVLDANATQDSLATNSSAAEYEAPEVWRTPQQVDARADQFSLGVVLYETLAGQGRRPFRVDFRRVAPQTEGQAVIEVSHSPQNDLRSLVPDAPERLVRVIERATRLNAANRFESFGQMAESLRAVLKPEEQAPVSTARSHGHWTTWAGIAVIMLVLVAVIIYFVQPLVVGSRAREQIVELRDEAVRLDAAQYASALWRQAETYQPAGAYEDRVRLYRAARDAAWRVRLSNAGEAARHAIDFEATSEPAFAQAVGARKRAEQEWANRQLELAAGSLTEADEGFRTAVAARRGRWAEQIRRQLAAEVAKVTLNSSGMDVTALRAQQLAIEKTITDTEASPDDFRRAENAVADLRHEVAAAMTGAGKVEVARRSAEEAINAAEQARRIAEPWSKAFERGRGPYDRGTAFMLSARDAIDKDPSRALALADAAAGRFRSVQSASQADITAQRQVALVAQRRADRHKAKVRAESLYAAAEKTMARGDQLPGNGIDEQREQRDAYIAAKQKFEEADQAAVKAQRAEAANLHEEAAEREQAERAELEREQAQHQEAAARLAPPARVTPPAPAVQRPVPRQAEPPPPAAPAVAALPPAKGLEPMSPNLAREIQQWMSQHCESVNRGLQNSESRARCENLTVHDRRDVAHVHISYTYTVGSRSTNGINWQSPTIRSMQLDCSGSNCRCISGPDC